MAVVARPRRRKPSEDTEHERREEAETIIRLTEYIAHLADPPLRGFDTDHRDVETWLRRLVELNPGHPAAERIAFHLAAAQKTAKGTWPERSGEEATLAALRNVRLRAFGPSDAEQRELAEGVRTHA